MWCKTAWDGGGGWWLLTTVALFIFPSLCRLQELIILVSCLSWPLCFLFKFLFKVAGSHAISPASLQFVATFYACFVYCSGKIEGSHMPSVSHGLVFPAASMQLPWQWFSALIAYSNALGSFCKDLGSAQNDETGVSGVAQARGCFYKASYMLHNKQPGSAYLVDWTTIISKYSFKNWKSIMFAVWAWKALILPVMFNS